MAIKGFMSSDSEEFLRQDSTRTYLVTLDEYKEAVVRLFPALPRRLVHSYSLSPVDALVVGHFLEHYPGRATMLEIGTFVGVSAFCFAKHPKVSKVIGVDPNPLISEEVTSNSDKWVGKVKFEALEGLRVLDIARATLAEFDGVGRKIEFREGVVGVPQTGIERESTSAAAERVEVPVEDPSGEVGLVAFVDGLHTREGVFADLKAIFGRNPRAVAFLDDCCHKRGPFVQAGAADFIDQAPDKYHFRLARDLGPELRKSNLGVVYADSAATEIEGILESVSKTLGQRMDPLQLLKREEKLADAANRTNHELVQMFEQNSRLEEQVSRLEARNSRLKTKLSRLEKHYSSRRYKLADGLVGKARRIAGLKDLLRRVRPKVK